MRLIAGIVFFGSMISLFPQERPPGVTVAGTVVNGLTGEPLARAEVTLAAFSESFRPSRVLTGADGTFRFEGVPAGQISLWARKPQFQPVSQTPSPAAEAKVSREDYRLVLYPLAAISGQVMDDDGFPLQSVQVELWRVMITDGRKQPVKFWAASTDDQGAFRMAGLRPGKYYVRASGRSGGTRLYMGDRAPGFDANECFEPVYAGGGTDLQQAQPMVLTYGQNARADFTLRLRPAVKIRGAVSGFVPYQQTKIELMRGQEDVSSNRAMLNMVNGSFEVSDVFPGSYTLRVTQTGERPARGEVALVVGRSDVNGVRLSLAPAVTLPFEVKCKMPREADPQLPSGCPVAVMLLTAGGDHILMEEGASGKSAQVLPGEYEIDVSAPLTYVRAIRYGGEELPAGSKLVVRGDEVPGPVAIELAEEGGMVEGSIEEVEAKAPAAVLLVPQFDSFQRAQRIPAQAGRFRAMGLPPGEYAVYLFANPEEVEYANRAAMQRYTPAATVNVPAKGTVPVRITRFSE